MRFLAAFAGLLLSAVVARRLRRRRAFPWRRIPSPGRVLASALLSPENAGTRVPVEPGMRVLIVGPTDPRWVRAIVHALGRYGKLYVAESSAPRASVLRARLRAERLAEVEVLVASGPRLELPDSTIDLVVCVGALAGRPRRERLLWELQRTLRPGGHLSVSEGLYSPRYLRMATLRSEAQAVGLIWDGHVGTPLAYTATLRKPA